MEEIIQEVETTIKCRKTKCQSIDEISGNKTLDDNKKND